MQQVRKSSKSKWQWLLLIPGLVLAACRDDAEVPPTAPTQVTLPGNTFYPESVHASADGTLYIGSFMTGEIVRVPADISRAEQFHAPGADGVVAVLGVLVDDARQKLWVCAVDTSGTTPPRIKSFSLENGAQVDDVGFPQAAFPNDLALDPAGNLFVTDSAGGVIYRLPSGGSSLQKWAEDARWVPSPGEFSLDGIVVADPENIFVNLFTRGELYRVKRKADGTAGEVTTVTVSPALSLPDAMRRIDETSFYVVQGTGVLSRVTVNADGKMATSTSIRTGLDQPTSVAIVGGTAWVAEGQLLRLFASPPEQPRIPFVLRSVDL